MEIKLSLHSTNRTPTVNSDTVQYELNIHKLFNAIKQKMHRLYQHRTFVGKGVPYPGGSTIEEEVVESRAGQEREYSQWISNHPSRKIAEDRVAAEATSANGPQ